jgi:opacity protein-like surface antigen
VYGDVGGIIFGSDVTWQGIATVNYQVSRKMNLGVGWRYFKVDYSKGDFLYDVAQSGPIIVFRTIL